jgi:hypothetical protein
MMDIAFSVSGRKALPVRAIPFVAGIDPFSRNRNLPPSLIWEAARQAAEAWSSGIPELRFYRLDYAGVVKPVTAEFMDASVHDADLQPENDYPIFVSVTQLPPDWFVFADDLQAFVDWLFQPGAHDGYCRERIELNLCPDLPSELIDVVAHCVDRQTDAPARNAAPEDSTTPKPVQQKKTRKDGLRIAMEQCYEDYFKQYRVQPTARALFDWMAKCEHDLIVEYDEKKDGLVWQTQDGRLRTTTFDAFQNRFTGLKKQPKSQLYPV